MASRSTAAASGRVMPSSPSRVIIATAMSSWRLRSRVAPASRSSPPIGAAKAEIFPGLEPGGVAVINRDNPHYERLAAAARSARVERIVSFGEHARADARLVKSALQADRSSVQARVLGADVTYKLGA